MKVLNVINALVPGGAETLILEIMLWLLDNPQHNLEMHLCTLYPPSPHMISAAQRIKWHRLDKKFRYDLRLIFELEQLIKENRYDIVHVHLFPSLYFGAMVSFMAQNPVYIYTEHTVFSRRRKKFFQLPELAIHASYKKIIAVGWQVAQNLKEWLPPLANKIIVIPNGVKIPPAPKAVRHIPVLCVGSLYYWKGQDILIEALSLLYQAMGELCPKVIIVGDGPMRNTLERRIKEKGLKDYIKLLGRLPRNQVLQLMEQAQLLVLPSRWEGAPMVILEAMAREVPIVATTVGDIPRLVQHEITGLLVPPEDPLALSEAIMDLHLSPKKARNMGKNARKIVVENYSISLHIEKLAELYHQLLSSQ